MTSVDLDWDRWTWPDLVRGAESYRASFSQQGREDFAYFRCRRALGDVSMAARAGRSRQLVEFLNAWACRLDTKRAPAVFSQWIRAHAQQLEDLEPVTLTDDDVPTLDREIEALYDSLMRLRGDLHNMSDAAASKVLHQLCPSLFVMWDKAIKQAARSRGLGEYAAFVVGMHRVGKRVLEDSGMDRSGAETYLQQRFGYVMPKSLAKYIDEANWYWAVGQYSALRGV